MHFGYIAKAILAIYHNIATFPNIGSIGNTAKAISQKREQEEVTEKRLTVAVPACRVGRHFHCLDVVVNACLHCQVPGLLLSMMNCLESKLWSNFGPISIPGVLLPNNSEKSKSSSFEMDLSCRREQVRRPRGFASSGRHRGRRWRGSSACCG